MNLDIFDRINNFTKDKGDFIRDFMNELRDVLDKSNKTYFVASHVDNNNEVFIATQDGTGTGKHYKLEELPSNIEYGTILRYKNGKFVVDESLTKNSLEEDRKAREDARNLVSQYKMNGTEYLVKTKLDEYVVLLNKDTGLEFSSSDFYKEDFEKLSEGMILKCENNEYIIKKD